MLGPRWSSPRGTRRQARLYPRIETLADDDRNLLWVLFCDPATRN